MAENLQEYYKRMAEAIDTQLEQKGKAALFYPCLLYTSDAADD